MVKLVQINSMASHAPSGTVGTARLHGQPERDHQHANPDASSAAAPLGRNYHPQISDNGSIAYPQAYYHRNHAMSSAPTSGNHHHRAAPRSRHYEGTHNNSSSHYMIENAALPPHSRGAPYRQSNNYNTADMRRPYLRRYESASYGRYHPTQGGQYRGGGPRLPPTNHHQPHLMAPPPPTMFPPYGGTPTRLESSGRLLQTIEPNKTEQSKEEERKPAAMEKSSAASRHDQENPRPLIDFLKSPVTMCFERMLGAAKYLANNPTPDHVKKQLALKDASVSSEESSQGEECQSSMKRKSIDNTSVAGDTEQQSQPKRIRGLKPFLISSEEADKLSELGEENPFVQLLHDEALYHQVILLMTLEAETKDSKKTSESEGPVPMVIGEGFFWRDYPELEQILYDNMARYYNMSLTSRQSRVQQQFNNHMVACIRKAAIASGYSFDPNFNDKRLRDRMRCFYKTHLQNAKKRLATMQKHPQSHINQSQLRIWIKAAKEQMNKFTEETEEHTVSSESS